MSSRDAIKALINAGFRIVRQGNGSHLILESGSNRIVISNGRQELSSGMTRKVRSYARAKA